MALLSDEHREICQLAAGLGAAIACLRLYTETVVSG